jgi:hypothetical protein
MSWKPSLRVSAMCKCFFFSPQHRDLLWGEPSLFSIGYCRQLPPGGGGSGGDGVVKLATHFHLVGRSSAVELYLHFHLSLSGGLWSKKFGYPCRRVLEMAPTKCGRVSKQEPRYSDPPCLAFCCSISWYLYDTSSRRRAVSCRSRVHARDFPYPFIITRRFLNIPTSLAISCEFFTSTDETVQFVASAN